MSTVGEYAGIIPERRKRNPLVLVGEEAVLRSGAPRAPPPQQQN